MIIPKLILPKGEQLLTRVEYLIGRHKKCDICLFDDPKASRFHATEFRENGLHYIKDGRIGLLAGGVIQPGIRSSNGTFVNGVRLNEETDWKSVLKHGDEIQIGQTVLIFWLPVLTQETDEGKETHSEKPN